MTLADADTFHDLAGIALALALGLLVGLQRGWALRKEAEGTRFAGVRTFGLMGLAGGLAGMLFAISEPLATLMFAATVALILAGFYLTASREKSISGTASIAAVVTLGCGFLAATGRPQSATAIAVSMVVVLALRNRLHRLVGQLNEAEVGAVVRFALIAAVILPLLPDRAYGPYDAWNPRSLWLVVVLVSGFSFAGYIATRQLGPKRGTIAAAAAGAMVSSTAVTAWLANRLKDAGEQAGERDIGGEGIIHASIAAASAVMFLRLIVLVGWLTPSAMSEFAVLAAPGLAVSLIGAVWFLRRAPPGEHGETAAMNVRNPFDLGPALLLMGLVMAMSLAARWALDQLRQCRSCDRAGAVGRGRCRWRDHHPG